MTIRLKFRKIRGREGLESLLFRPWENTEGWMQMGKTMEEKAFREHVSWVMFLLSILVIWAHSYNAELFSGGAPVTEGIWLTVHRIQDFLSAALGLTAVPGFFMLSVPFFPQLFLGEASGKMEEPGPQRGGPLSGLESFLLSGLCAGNPHSGCLPAHWKTAGAI